jgi:hypothetical protein
MKKLPRALGIVAAGALLPVLVAVFRLYVSSVPVATSTADKGLWLRAGVVLGTILVAWAWRSIRRDA